MHGSSSEATGPVNTWMESLAVCLLCGELGVKDTVMSFPAEPRGGKTPEEGITVKSLLLPGRNVAVKCIDLLDTKHQILCFKEYCGFFVLFVLVYLMLVRQCNLYFMYNGNKKK